MAKETTWTFGAAPDTDWLTVGNWSNGVAVATDTIDISSTTTPTNIPDQTGETYHFSITNPVSVTLANWINGGSIGNVAVNDAGASITAGANITGLFVASLGTLIITQGETVTGSGTILGATLQCTGAGTVTASDDWSVVLTGTLQVDNGTTLDFAATKGLIGGGAGASVINNGTIVGLVNLASGGVWTTGTGTITVDETGTLNLGTDDDNNQTVDINGAGKTITLGDHFRCHGLTLTAGTLDMASKTVTVGGGGFAHTDAVVLANVGNIVVAETCHGRWEDYGDPLASLTVNASQILTVGAAGSEDVRMKVLVNNGTIDLLNSSRVQVYLAGSNFWSGTGTVTTAATGTVTVTLAGDTTTLTGVIRTTDIGVALTTISLPDATLTGGAADLGTGSLTVYHKDDSDKLTWTVGTGVACGNLVLGTGAKEGGLDMNGHDLSMSGDMLFDGENCTVVLGSGTHTIGGEIKRNTGDETGCSLDFATSKTTLDGDVTLAGITAAFGSARIVADGITINGGSATAITASGSRIDCGGTGRVTAVTATGQRLVVHRAVDSGGSPVRSWNGDGCTNVRFLGRRVIGDRLRAVA